MIRYRTKDLTRLLLGTARSMRRMEKITGRVDDMIILRGVNVFPTHIEEQLLTIGGLSSHFQIELSRQGRMDQMKILVEATQQSADGDSRKVISETLAKRIKDTIGISTMVDVATPGGVERSQGKAKRVVDNKSN